LPPRLSFGAAYEEGKTLNCAADAGFIWNLFGDFAANLDYYYVVT
jgi:hypothetical protein